MSSARPHRVAFLLAQLGADASAAFEQAVSALGITPSEAGLLRLVGRTEGISQKAAAQQLGVGPSRIVAVLDGLEQRGFVERHRSEIDRRSHELRLTTEGHRMLGALRPVARAHEAAFTDGLDDADAGRLAAYLERIAAARGLGVEVHRETRPGT